VSRPDQPEGAAPSVVDWRPDRAEAMLLNVLSLPLMVVGIVGFLRLATLRLPASGRLVIGLRELLLFLLSAVALTTVLLLAHEGIHGLVMAAFGARPRFGAMMIANVAPALYATAPGHLFSRGQYLAVAVAPALVISVVGGLACLTALGPFLVLPLAFHLGGCIGDAVATLRLLRQAPGTRCEDMRDGIRFHRPAARSRRG
jgi:preprotein translocase subunit Sss1